jgi:hypothetical protein
MVGQVIMSLGIIGWLVALGCCAIGLGAAVWGFDFPKHVAIWFLGFPGAICLVVAGCLELQSLGSQKPVATNFEIRQSRAYVVLDEIVANWGKDDLSDNAPITAWKFVVRWKNSGRTPANDFHAQPDIIVFDAKGMPDDFNVEMPFRVTAPIAIGASQSRDVGNVELPMSAVLEMKAKTKRFYLWVSSNYRDIYDDTPVRHTDFAGEIKISGDVTVGGSPFSFEIVRQHSRTD